MTKRFLRNTQGQALIEFAFAMPIIVILALGVVETSWALLDAHIVTRLAREGSNLISRDTSPGDTVAALNHAGAADDLTFVSTAGGAFLEWMEGKTLPGVAALSQNGE